jgi:GSH-dependent disulfide-bond oxidoreductase
MIKLYFHRTPNPTKVAIALEELGLPYEVAPIDMFKGEQHQPAYRALNPNGKVPAIVDDDGVIVFDSNAILLYLAEKSGGLTGIVRRCCRGCCSPQRGSARFRDRQFISR